MKILFIGSNPSKHNVDPQIPFKGTRSETILKTWMSNMGSFDYEFFNVLDQITENNRPLTKAEIKRCIVSLREKIAATRYDRIVALGNTASEALKLLKLSHFKLPHPSPRNRALNNKKELDNQIEMCKVYIWSKE